MFGEKFGFEDSDTRITDLKEIRRWTTWVKTQVRIGIELEKGGRARTPLGSPSLHDAVQSTSNYDRLGPMNVNNIVRDVSVSGDGNEILVTGNIEDFATAHRKMAALHELLRKYKLKVNNTCGMHYHLIAAQDDNMPEIILKNFYQLVRRYYAALIYMTSTTGLATTGRRRRYYAPPVGGIIRGGASNYAARGFLGISPVTKDMSVIKQEIIGKSGRYGGFNMGDGSRGKDLMKFDVDSGRVVVSRFHVELRFPDGSDSAAQVVAQMFLFRALLLKAVELSQFGVLKVNSDENKWTMNKNAAAAFYGFSFEMTLAQAAEFAKNDAESLLKSLRSALMSIDGESYTVLEKIIETPVWKRRRENKQSWLRIEKTLMPPKRVLQGMEDNLLRLITLNEITGFKTMQHWKHEAATRLNVTDGQLVGAFRKLERQVRLDFDRTTGTFLAVW